MILTLPLRAWDCAAGVPPASFSLAGFSRVRLPRSTASASAARAAMMLVQRAVELMAARAAEAEAVGRGDRTGEKPASKNQAGGTPAAQSQARSGRVRIIT